MDDILMIASVAVTLFGVFMLRHKRFRRLRHYIGWYFLIVGCVILLRITLFPQAPLAFGRLSYNIMVIGSVIAFLFLLFPIAVLDPKVLTPRYILTVAAPAGGVLFCLALSGSTPELNWNRFGNFPAYNRSESLMRLLLSSWYNCAPTGSASTDSGPQTSWAQKMALRLSGDYQNDHAVLQFMKPFSA